MTINTFTSGVNTSFSSELNQNSASFLKAQGRNLIRQLQDRSVAFTADGGEWAEAYTDSDGRKDSVDTDNTTSIFDTDKYVSSQITQISGGSTVNTGSFVNPDNLFDGDSGTYASVDDKDTGEYIIGKTFSSTYVGYCKVKFTTNTTSGATSVKLQKYDGDSWSDVQEWTDNDLDVDTTVAVDDTIEGLRFSFNLDTTGSTADGYAYRLDVSETVDTIITHDIPSGTFSSTISIAFGTALVEDWESEADIQYKLTNTGGDDSGWLAYNEISTFTAFTAEPDTCIVKLIPKTTSPTEGYPSINGFAVFE